VRAYLIRSGCRFRTADGQVKVAGDVIELDDDVAQVHAEKLEPVEPASAEPDTAEASPEGAP
jgi:hypothetical protein